VNQKKSSQGQTFFALAIALMVLPEWVTIYHTIDSRPSWWIASMLLSTFIITFAALAWRGLHWAKITVIVLISLGVLIKTISLVSGQFIEPALISLACYVTGLLLILVPPSVDNFLEGQRRDYESNRRSTPPGH
jgi:hypothetical protein